MISFLVNNLSSGFTLRPTSLHRFINETFARTNQVFAKRTDGNKQLRHESATRIMFLEKCNKKKRFVVKITRKTENLQQGTERRG